MKWNEMKSLLSLEGLRPPISRDSSTYMHAMSYFGRLFNRWRCVRFWCMTLLTGSLLVLVAHHSYYHALNVLDLTRVLNSCTYTVIMKYELHFLLKLGGICIKYSFLYGGKSATMNIISKSIYRDQSLGDFAVGAQIYSTAYN